MKRCQNSPFAQIVLVAILIIFGLPVLDVPAHAQDEPLPSARAKTTVDSNTVLECSSA